MQNGTPPHYTDFVGTLEKIFTDDKGTAYVSVRWFYRPEVCDTYKHLDGLNSHVRTAGDQGRAQEIPWEDGGMRFS